MVKLRKKILRLRNMKKNVCYFRNNFTTSFMPYVLHTMNHSMTQLLTYTVAHSTRPSFRLKINSQPIKKVFKSCVQLSKSSQKWQNSDFQSPFSKSKIICIFQKNFHWKLWFCGHTLCYQHFLKTSLFRPLYFLKWRPIFGDFYSTDRKT